MPDNPPTACESCGACGAPLRRCEFCGALNVATETMSLAGARSNTGSFPPVRQACAACRQRLFTIFNEPSKIGPMTLGQVMDADDAFSVCRAVGRWETGREINDPKLLSICMAARCANAKAKPPEPSEEAGQ